MSWYLYYLPLHFNGYCHIQFQQLFFCFVVSSITTKTSKFRIYKITQNRAHLLWDSHYTPLSLLFSYHWPMEEVNNSKSVISRQMLRLKSMKNYFEIQHWFMWWLGVARHQAIMWANITQSYAAVLCHKATLSWLLQADTLLASRQSKTSVKWTPL